MAVTESTAVHNNDNDQLEGMDMSATGSDYDDDFLMSDPYDPEEYDGIEEEEGFYDEIGGPGMFTTEGTKGLEERRSHCQVEYQTHSVSELVQLQREEAAKVSGVFGIPMSHATMMLRSMRWNKERFFERFTENPEKVQLEAGIITLEEAAQRRVTPKVKQYFDDRRTHAMASEVKEEGGKVEYPDWEELSPEAQTQRNLVEFIPEALCEICFGGDPSIPTYALPCGHRFCVECYREYLTHKIRDEGLSARIQCPSSQCPIIVGEPVVEMLVSSADFARYQNLLLRSYVSENDTMRWCTAPGCEYIIECHTPQSALSSTVPTVRCKCGHAFCFGCGLDDHQPCLCILVRKWLKKCSDESETSTWISINTQECPRCQAVIEKNGGCNHMTCRKCHHEFCWVCLGPWSQHGRAWYNCNRYEESASKQARSAQEKSREALTRYLHYQTRYANHERSADLDRDLYRKTERKMELMQQASNLSWIEVQFLRDAADTLMQCRMTLKWTYAFAFYLVPNNMTELFEDNQRDLEMATEQLSGFLESPINPDTISTLRQQVLDKTAYVTSRRKVVLEDTARGFAEDRWDFNVSLTE
ncbi:hypothetical protein IWQ61_004365 [Dispira simplex]|nr:hypothetical protein IWQ61_004365 [Dispira simplex]